MYFSMMIHAKTISFFSLLLVFFFSSCNSESPYAFLKGKWEIDSGDRPQYEYWEESESGEGLIGRSYILLDGEEQDLESLEIRHEGDDIVLVATVLNQNAGLPIRFELNQDETEWLSFENPEHDFPKEIRYQKVTDDRLQVEVLGAGDTGFEMTYNRVKP